MQGAAAAELGRGQLAALGVPVRFVDVRHIRDQPAHFVHELHATQRRGGQGGAVVTVPAADHDLLVRLANHLPVAAHGTDQHLVGLGAGVGVDRVAVVPRQQAEQQLGQFDHRRVGGVEEHVVVRQLFQLLGRGGGEVLAAVAEVGAPEAGHAVEVALAVVVPQVQAFATDDHPRPFGVQRLLVEEGMDVVRGIGCLVVAGLALRGERRIHCWFSFAVGLQGGLRSAQLAHVAFQRVLAQHALGIGQRVDEQGEQLGLGTDVELGVDVLAV
ncbi:hypothetical protein D3C72_990850 [compost metagenome]